MKILSKEELDKMGEFLAGHSDELIIFIGRVNNETSLIDEQIKSVLEGLGCNYYNKAGQNINELFKQIEQNSSLKDFKKYLNFKSKFNDLNKIRIYTTHATSMFNEDGTLVLIKEDHKQKQNNAIIFDRELIKETNKLIDVAYLSLAEIHQHLGLIED